MAVLFIHARNSTFHSCDEGNDYAAPEDALAFGVRSAVALVAEEIDRGERNAAVEISVVSSRGRQLLRSVVAISVSPLIVGSALHAEQTSDSLKAP